MIHIISAAIRHAAEKSNDQDKNTDN